MKKILSYGELLWDVVFGEKYIGGAPFNFSANCAALGCDSAMITKIGADEMGKQALEALDAYAVSKRFVQTDTEHETGSAVARMNGNDVTYDIKQNAAYSYIAYEKELDQHLTAFAPDCFYFGSVIQESAVSCATLDKILKTHPFPLTFCDLNLRKEQIDPATLQRCLTYSDILKINRDEAVFLSKVFGGGDYKSIAKGLATRFPKIRMILITLDADGAYLYHCKQNKEYFVGAKAVTVVSAVGAGDAFSAGFLVGYFNTGDFVKALDVATGRAALSLASKQAVSL